MGVNAMEYIFSAQLYLSATLFLSFSLTLTLFLSRAHTRTHSLTVSHSHVGGMHGLEVHDQSMIILTLSTYMYTYTYIRKHTVTRHARP